MLLYNSNTNEISESFIVNGIKTNIPKPKRGVYEYQKTKINENQSLGNIIIENDIATNVVIPFEDWKNTKDYNNECILNCIRIIISKELVITGGDYKALADNMVNMKKPYFEYSESQMSLYLNQIIANDGQGFYVENGNIISNDLRLIVQGINSNFEEVDGIIKQK